MCDGTPHQGPSLAIPLCPRSLHRICSRFIHETDQFTAKLLQLYGKHTCTSSDAEVHSVDTVLAFQAEADMQNEGAQDTALFTGDVAVQLPLAWAVSARLLALLFVNSSLGCCHCRSDQRLRLQDRLHQSRGRVTSILKRVAECAAAREPGQSPGMRRGLVACI